MAKGPGRAGGGEWGHPVPLLPDRDPWVGAMIRDLWDEYEVHREYRRILEADIGKLSARIVAAFHYFGTAGVRESDASARLRQTDPNRWWGHMDRFFDLLECWAEKLDEAATIRLRVTLDPPDLDLLVRAILRSFADNDAT